MRISNIIKKTGFVFLLFFILIAIFSLLSQDLYEEDSTTHFLFARYAFKHPWAFVDIWARPIPTLLQAFPSQVGVLASRSLQIIITIFAGFFFLKLARTLGLKYEYQGLALFLFQPFLFLTSYNILTEPFFVLVFVCFLYLFYQGFIEKSLIVLSLLPLTRPEGYLIFPLIIIYLILNKKIRLHHPFLMLIGTIIWWTAGLIIFSNLTWFIDYFPWGGKTGYYGFGKAFDYLSLIPNVVPFVGLPFLIWGFFLSFNKKLWFIPAICVAYLFFYSFIWTKGILRAFLCPRYLAILAPLFSLMMARALERIPESIGALILSFYIIISMHTVHRTFPFSIYPDHQTIREVYNWCSINAEKNARIVCAYPYFFYISNKDPFDFERHPLPNKRSISTLKPDDIIIWDSNFMAKEIPEDSLKDSNLLEIARFQNKFGFAVVIYRKIAAF